MTELAANGDVRDPYRETGPVLGNIGALTDGSRVRVEEGDALVSYPLAGTDVQWERDLGDACGSGTPEEIGVTALGWRAVAS
ncbi:hypothetical protein ACWFMI_00545 [Nocardiopsis terrae]